MKIDKSYQKGNKMVDGHTRSHSMVTLYLFLIYLFLKSTTYGPQSVPEFTGTSKLHWFHYVALLCPVALDLGDICHFPCGKQLNYI